jgi:hypothetical protein
VINITNGQRRTLIADYPKFLYDPSVVLPFWNEWEGIIYDPTLTFAIYPQFIGTNGEQYTYALWNTLSNRLVTSLDTIFASYTGWNFLFPMPVWSPDGSKFVVRGYLLNSNPSPTMELYLVSKTGQITQLTHLTNIAYIEPDNISWSPDGRYIAMYLNHWEFRNGGEMHARLAVLDTATLKLTDYCFPINYFNGGSNGGLSVAIWSPDSKQLLVTDLYNSDHQRVILVDIENNIAAQIAEDVEPIGWMTSPK